MTGHRAERSTLYTSLESPLGGLLLVGDRDALHGLYMQDAPDPIPFDPGWRPCADAFAEVAAQLSEYFAGRRTTFEVELAMAGTPFQHRVWDALREIGYGETRTYGELARRIDRPGAARAVGAANGRNPIAVIVPCHRVIGAGGALTGFGGGIGRKRLLLELEASPRASVTPSQ
ncbi:MAG TPA: methylated-DNA--[protein]-cysteine S-methyltransferase [Solirubrobacteraceae bacterium]|nr:methylated-DNA--[protein]-cysteine S-methyltransferase [Solirubrobacteraceae bacterium]